jgi:hypothetical protein
MVYEKTTGELGEKDGRAALLPAAREGNAVSSFGLR